MRNLIRIALGTYAASVALVAVAVMPAAGDNNYSRDVRLIHLTSTVPQYVRSLGQLQDLGTYLYVRQLSVDAYLSEQASLAQWYAGVEQATAQQAAETQQSLPGVIVLSRPDSGASAGGDPWTRVAICEESGRNDPTYGYFGIMPQSWAAYGGAAYSATAGGSSWATQEMIASRISGASVPDASGCGSW